MKPSTACAWVFPNRGRERTRRGNEIVALLRQRSWIFGSVAALIVAYGPSASVRTSQQRPVESIQPPAVRPIQPPRRRLPEESRSSGVTRFSFIAYGDTRSPVDGQRLQPEHGALVDRMLATITSLALSRFPVRFVLQSGDAVSRGTEAAQWN